MGCAGERLVEKSVYWRVRGAVPGASRGGHSGTVSTQRDKRLNLPISVRVRNVSRGHI